MLIDEHKKAVVLSKLSRNSAIALSDKLNNIIYTEKDIRNIQYIDYFIDEEEFKLGFRVEDVDISKIYTKITNKEYGLINYSLVIWLITKEGKIVALTKNNHKCVYDIEEVKQGRKIDIGSYKDYIQDIEYLCYIINTR